MTTTQPETMSSETGVKSRKAKRAEASDYLNHFANNKEGAEKGRETRREGYAQLVNE